MIIRASSIGKLMTEPTAAAKKAGEVLSVGAKTYLRDMFKQEALNYHDVITSKYMDKGIQCEQDSINLLNDVFFTDYVKNTERKTEHGITGECDIFTGSKVIDIKTSWDLSTFPIFLEEAKNELYEWQLRAYMMLWNVDHAELAYCMVNTPAELIRFEPVELHRVDHISPERRVTILTFERDAEKEAAMIERVRAAEKYWRQLKELYEVGK